MLVVFLKCQWTTIILFASQCWRNTRRVVPSTCSIKSAPNIGHKMNQFVDHANKGLLAKASGKLLLFQLFVIIFNCITKHKK